LVWVRKLDILKGIWVWVWELGILGSIWVWVIGILGVIWVFGFGDKACLDLFKLTKENVF